MKIFILRNLYIFLFIVTIVIIIFTPLLVGDGVPLIGEETLEAIIISLLFVVSYILYALYNKEIEKSRAELKDLQANRLTLEERLDEAFKHIGQVNIQIEEVRSIFGEFKKYPESKSDFKNILRYFSEKILGMVEVDWVILKIIDLASIKTLKEYSHCRGPAVLLKSKIENRDLVNQAGSSEYMVLSSHQNNLNIKAYCIIPKKTLKPETEILLKAIVDQLEMIFIIFSSDYFKKNHKLWT
jgi:hypothetical protein